MFKKIFLFINILYLSHQLDHCIRTYEICNECESGYFIVQNEYQYICSHIKNCLTITSDICSECTNGDLPKVNEDCEIIDNCRKYDQTAKCSECIDGYALSYDHNKCIKYNNCRELDPNNKCELCAKHYKLSKSGNCLRSTCEEEENRQCIKCTEGFYLLDGNYVKIPIDYCSDGDEESCIECFHYAPTLSNGKCILDKLISGCNKPSTTDDTKCIQCSMGYELSSDHTKCELTHCSKIEEVCYQCENGYYIADNGNSCLDETEEEKDTDLSFYLMVSSKYFLFTALIFL